MVVGYHHFRKPPYVVHTPWSLTVRPWKPWWDWKTIRLPIGGFGNFSGANSETSGYKLGCPPLQRCQWQMKVSWKYNIILMVTVTKGDKSPKSKYLTYQNGKTPKKNTGEHSGFHIGFLKSPPEQKKHVMIALFWQWIRVWGHKVGPYHLYIYIWSYSLVTNPYNEMALQISNWGYFTPKTGSGGPPCRTPRHISCMTAKISSWNIHHANKYIKISFQTLQTHHFLQIFVGNPGHYHLSPATTFENIYIYICLPTK